jgi:hypothetical protein
MGLGASILALDTPFNREALGEEGRYFTRFDAGLSKQIERIVAEPRGAADPLRLAARSRAGSEFRLEDVADAVEGVLTAAAARRSRGSVAIDTRWSPAIRLRVPAAARSDRTARDLG